VLGLLGDLLGALAKIPGPWQHTFQTAAKAVDHARDRVKALTASVNATPTRHTTVFHVPTLAAARHIAGLNGDIKRTPRGWTVTFHTRTAAAHAQIRSLQAAINRIHGKSVTVRIATIRTYTKGYQAARVLDSRASGGPVRPHRTYWVGEKGPELVRFAGPAHVYSHAQSTRMASASIPGLAAGGRIGSADPSITIAPGAVQIGVTGDLDEAVGRSVTERIEGALGDLARELAAR
jgi:hypothetical protein